MHGKTIQYNSQAFTRKLNFKFFVYSIYSVILWDFQIQRCIVCKALAYYDENFAFCGNLDFCNFF